MLEHLIRWSLRNRWLVLLVWTIVSAVGVLSLANLPIDAFPDTTPVQVQINTVSPSLVPEEVERQITFPVEMAISGLPGLTQVRSISQFGLSQVVVTFADGTDIYFARQLINERMGTVELAPGIDRPQMGPVATGLGEVLHYVVRGADGDLARLRTAQDWLIKPQIRPVAGTAEVNSWGGLVKQYQIRIDPLQLIKYDLTFEQVLHAVKSNNLNVGGGNLDRAGDALLVHGIGRTNTPAQIENIVLTARDGTPVLLKDVARLEMGHEVRRGAVTYNGKGEGVLGLGFMLMGESSYVVTNRQRQKVEEIKKTLPEDLKIDVVYDRTELVDQVIKTVRNNLLEGGLLVVALLYMFLGNLRAGLIVALAIPLSMLFAFNGMLRFGIAGTLLSLGAIDFGIVVDSSVVVLENVIHKLGHNKHELTPEQREQAVAQATIEVRTPAVFGQLIIMIVYLPILALEGVEGKMFRPMALTVIFVLLGSLLVSLTLMPVLAYLLLPKKVEDKEVFLVRLARWIYRPLLRLVLRMRLATLGVAVAMLTVTVSIAGSLGTEFTPQLSEGALVIGIVRMPGTSLNESIARNTQMEKELLEKFPNEIKTVWSRAGAPEVATDAGSIEETDMFITLHPREKWRKELGKSQAKLVELIDREVGNLPGQITWFTQPIEQRINEMLAGARADVALKIVGDDLDVLMAKGKEVEKILRQIDGCQDLAVQQIAGMPIMRIRIKQDQIARYGVSVDTVLNLIESLGGKVVGNVIEGQVPFPLTLRLPESYRYSPETVASIPVATASGEQIPLSRLADVAVEEGPKQITREWGHRRMLVQCNVRGRDIGSFVAEAQEKVAAAVQLPTGYKVEWGGQFENMQRAQARLGLVAPVALGLIVVLLYLTYRNVRDTALVFSSVPFGCVGGVLALYWREMPISVSAAVGFITLSGVSVLNGMIYVSLLRNLLQHGVAPFHVVEETSVQSLRTVLMTALVASVGFIPMAISIGMGAEVQRPLATVVIGGVISSTVFTVFVLPVLYACCRLRAPEPLPSAVA